MRAQRKNCISRRVRIEDVLAPVRASRRSAEIPVEVDTGVTEFWPPLVRVFADGREVCHVIGRMELAVPATTRMLRFACTPCREQEQSCPDAESEMLTVEVEAEGRPLQIEVQDRGSPTASARRRRASAAYAVRCWDRCTLRSARNAGMRLRVAMGPRPLGERRTEAPASSVPSFPASVAGQP